MTPSDFDQLIEDLEAEGLEIDEAGEDETGGTVLIPFLNERGKELIRESHKESYGAKAFLDDIRSRAEEIARTRWQRNTGLKVGSFRIDHSDYTQALKELDKELTEGSDD